MILPPAGDKVPLEQHEDGVIRVCGTRVTLDSIVVAFENGATPEQITDQYPSLSLADTYAIIAFYFNHRDEVHDYLSERRSHAESVREDNLKRFDFVGIRRRLAARRTPKESY